MDIRPRPRFERFSSLEVGVLQQRLKRILRESGGNLRGEVLDGHAQLMIDGDRKHSWSPCLWLSYREVDAEARGAPDKRVRIRGMFGPRPGVWTLFATLYCVSVFIVFFGVVLGWAQFLLEKTPSGLLAIPVGMVLAGVLYLISLSGRALAHGEIDELLALLDGVLAEGPAANALTKVEVDGSDR